MKLMTKLGHEAQEKIADAMHRAAMRERKAHGTAAGHALLQAIADHPSLSQYPHRDPVRPQRSLMPGSTSLSYSEFRDRPENRVPRMSLGIRDALQARLTPDPLLSRTPEGFADSYRVQHARGSRDRMNAVAEKVRGGPLPEAEKAHLKDFAYLMRNPDRTTGLAEMENRARLSRARGRADEVLRRVMSEE